MSRINKHNGWKNLYPEAEGTVHCYECNALIWKSQAIDNLCIDCARKEFMVIKRQLESRQMFLENGFPGGLGG